MKYKSILIFILLGLNTIFPESKFQKIAPENIVEISVEGGVGTYLGNFADHLLYDGAYIVTPTLDLYLSLFIIKHLGIQILLGSGCIIHPKSQPIEGTILYMGIEIFGQYDWKHVYLKLFAGAGYEHTTMLIQWYASAFFEGGSAFGVKITDWLAWNLSVKCRVGFLHSIIIKKKYDLTENDRLMSITVSTGLSFRIKNPWMKK